MTVAVISPETTWVGLDSYPTPAGVIGNWSVILDFAVERYITTMVVPGSYADPPGYAMTAIEYGWEPGSVGDTGWVTFKRRLTGRGGHNRYVYLTIGFYDDMVGADPIIGDIPIYWEALASRLDQWRRATGTEYRVSPAVSAVASIRDMGRRLREQPRWILQHPATAEWWQPPWNIRSIQWTNPGAVERVLWHYDRRAAFLADASTTYLPLKQLRPTGTDPGPFGYFRLYFPDTEDGGRGAILGPVDDQGCRAVGHSTLEQLRRMSAPFEIVDSHTTDDAARILRPWAERWRTAIDEMPAAQPLLKSGYAQALAGLLAVPRGTIYRPDWRHLLADAGNAHVMRTALNLHKATGLWPERIDVDSLYYQADVTAHGLGLPLGDRIGNYKFKGVIP